MAGEPTKNYFLILLDAYAKWEGRIKAFGSLAGLLVFLIGAAGAALATALHSAASFLISFLTTLPLALSVGMLTALVTRYQVKNPLELAFAALLTFIGNSFLTRWLGLGLHIDYSQALDSLSHILVTKPNAYGFNPFHIILLFPFAILWTYFQLYGVVGFALSTATGFIAGRIIGGRR